MADYQAASLYKALLPLLVTQKPTQADLKLSFFGRLRRRISRKKLPLTSHEFTTFTPFNSDHILPETTRSATPFTYNPSAPTPLLTLPNELLLLIATFLDDPRDLNAILQANRRSANLFSPLCLQNIECCITALCWAVVTSNEAIMRVLLGPRGPGFVLLDREGSILYPTARVGRLGPPKLVGMFVMGPKLRICIPGILEEVTVRDWAESGGWRRVLSYCWSTDEIRGKVWERMVKEGLWIRNDGGVQRVDGAV